MFHVNRVQMLLYKLNYFLQVQLIYKEEEKSERHLRCWGASLNPQFSFHF